MSTLYGIDENTFMIIQYQAFEGDSRQILLTMSIEKFVTGERGHFSIEI